MTPIAQLDAAVKAVCPIEGVSVGNWDDKSTWRVSYKPEATQSEIDAAVSVIQNFDVQQAETNYSELDARCAQDEVERQECKTDSAIIGLIDQTRQEWVTWARNNFPSLTQAEQNRLGALFWVVAIGVRKFVRNGTR